MEDVKNGSDGAPPATHARQELRPRQIHLSLSLALLARLSGLTVIRLSPHSSE